MLFIYKESSRAKSKLIQLTLLTNKKQNYEKQNKTRHNDRQNKTNNRTRNIYFNFSFLSFLHLYSFVHQKGTRQIRF